MAWVYVLKGSSGRHYIGSAVDREARFAQHQRGHTYTTKRLGEALEIVASKEFPTLTEAPRIERMLKMLGSVETRHRDFARDCDADRVTDTLAEWTGRAFDARRIYFCHPERSRRISNYICSSPAFQH